MRLPSSLIALLICMLGVGCSRVKEFRFSDNWDSAPSYHVSKATQIEYPNVKSCLQPAVVGIERPLSLDNPAELETLEITLDEAIRSALGNGDILRSLGGSVVLNPQGSRTKFNPAIVETNPQAGVEAALSAFDAQVAGQLFWQKNNIPNNTTFLIFQPIALEQTASTFNYSISKRTATGASFAARHVVNYNRNNSPARFFPSDFTGWFEAEYRQPLMQGAGVEFNRIAGPNGGIGVYSGVLIARINTDISLADFEAGVIDFINDVETAYWELYNAYHNLEARVAGRNTSLLTWQRTNELLRVGARGGDRAAEAQARSQYYTFEAQVQEALAGQVGLYATEQQLRYLIGLPATDGRLLKPVTPPMEGEVVYDWDAALRDALTRRVEIRRQKWSIKRRELELIAARLNRKPTLDFLGLYRYRGLGDHLIGSRDPGNNFDNLYQNIFGGEYQEWQAGFELGYPVGLRQASAAVANARWNLARETAILREQELKITHDLSNAARQVTRSHAIMKTVYNRQDSDVEQVGALSARYEAGLDNINFLLQAQQALADSQSAYFRALTDYQLALRDFHREKGSLLNYNQVGLSEGPWPAEAYEDAQERGRFLTPRAHPGAVDVPSPVSEGCFDPTQVGAVQSMPVEGVDAVPLSPDETLSSPPMMGEPALPGDSPGIENIEVPPPTVEGN